MLEPRLFGLTAFARFVVAAWLSSLLFTCEAHRHDGDGRLGNDSSIQRKLSIASVVLCAVMALTLIVCAARRAWRAHFVGRNKKEMPVGTVMKIPVQTVTAEESTSQDPCAICLQPWAVGDEVKITPCGHRFHAECLDNWTKRSATCATCRRSLVEVEDVENPKPVDAPAAPPAAELAVQPPAALLGAPEEPGELQGVQDATAAPGETVVR
mmetsp:Transcript_17736/g.41266  ORF Transcript_17736/g.41266 Transcript_17736/m.41266 type:complete len:211 (-) Transcript_17736:272-904(-)